MVTFYVVKIVTTLFTTFFYWLLADYSGLIRNGIISKVALLLGSVDCFGLAWKMMWRRRRDSNPRYGLSRTHAFQACTFSRSVTSPGKFGKGAKNKPVPRFGQICFANCRYFSSKISMSRRWRLARLSCHPVYGYSR